MPPTTQKKMSVDEFAAKIKAKYPDYANTENKQLVDKIIAKYPQYKDSVQTDSTFGQKAMGFIQDALPVAGAVAGGIGGGILGGLATSPSIFGIPAGVIAGSAAGAGLGSAAGETAKEALKGQALNPGEIAKTGATYGALEAVGGPVASVAGKTAMIGGKTLAEAFIPKTQLEAGLLQAYKAGKPFIERIGNLLGIGKSTAPTTAGSAAFNQGVMGPESLMGTQAVKAQKRLWDGLIAPALKQAGQKVDLNAFFKTAEKQIVDENVDPTRQKALLSAFNAIKKDFGKVGKISLEQLQKYKEGWAKWVPEKAYKGQDISSSVNDVRDTLAGMARQHIYDALGPEVKQAYLDYGALHGISQLGMKAMTGAIKGGTGTSLKNLWEMATVPVGTIGGQTLYKVGQFAEFVGKPGAKTLRDVLGLPIGGAVLDTGNPGATPPTQ